MCTWVASIALLMNSLYSQKIKNCLLIIVMLLYILFDFMLIFKSIVDLPPEQSVPDPNSESRERSMSGWA
jgi:hypothetical protein